MSTDLPACCVVAPDARLSEQLYAAYNRGGDPERAGLNDAGKACPVWSATLRNAGFTESELG